MESSEDFCFQGYSYISEYPAAFIIRVDERIGCVGRDEYWAYVCVAVIMKCHTDGSNIRLSLSSDENI